MEVKKSSKANLENKKGIFFEIGLIVALACIFLAFEWKVDVKMEEGFIVINTEEQLDEEIIPVTQRIQQALPPPPPAPRLTDLIQIVDEEINLDDNLDIMDVEGIYAGQNLISKRGIWLDRRKLKNGNGAVLATSGAGKSFYIKDYIEQLLLKYPEDEVVILDPQGEYKPIIDALDGETVKLSPNSDTYINPFDADLNYGLDEDGKADPVKEKTEYILAFCQSLLSSTGEVALTGEERSIIDRCCGLIYADAEMHRFAKEYMPNLDKFYNALLEQNEYDAKNLALTLERFVHGSLSIFSHDTNVKIKKRLISFDISALPSSMQTTGYLVILDHVMNRLAHNHSLGRNTWLFIDEFHMRLKMAGTIISEERIVDGIGKQ